jgi:hypothetical protein
MTNDLNTAMRGMLNRLFPPFFKAHCTMNSASVVRTSSARAALTFVS